MFSTTQTVDLIGTTRTFSTNDNAVGVFITESNGAMSQRVGTSQTPRFRSQKQFASWVRSHLNSGIR